MENSLKLQLKVYFYACILLGINLLVIGFVVPIFLSSDDDLLPILGLTFLLLLPPVDWIIGRHMFKTLKGDKNEKPKKVSAAARSSRIN